VEGLVIVGLTGRLDDVMTSKSIFRCSAAKAGFMVSYRGALPKGIGIK